MMQKFIKKINDEDNILLDVEYNFRNRAFIIQFVKLELEHFEFFKIISEIRIDYHFYTNVWTGHEFRTPDIQVDIKKQYNELIEKYKGIHFCRQGLDELEDKINKKNRYNNQRRKELYNEHFNRNERQAIGCDEDKRNITKMIDACIEKNVEIEGINLIKFKKLRNLMQSSMYNAQNIDKNLFEECRIK